jgi:hypothetical protein
LGKNFLPELSLLLELALVVLANVRLQTQVPSNRVGIGLASVFAQRVFRKKLLCLISLLPLTRWPCAPFFKFFSELRIDFRLNLPAKNGKDLLSHIWSHL